MQGTANTQRQRSNSLISCREHRGVGEVGSWHKRRQGRHHSNNTEWVGGGQWTPKFCTTDIDSQSRRGEGYVGKNVREWKCRVTEQCGGMRSRRDAQHQQGKTVGWAWMGMGNMLGWMRGMQGGCGDETRNEVEKPDKTKSQKTVRAPRATNAGEASRRKCRRWRRCRICSEKSKTRRRRRGRTN